MKDLLIDIIRQVGPFEKIRILGTDTGTRVESYTEDRMLYLNADLNIVVPEFAGQFGIDSLPLLKRLLDYPPYKTDDSKLHVRRVSRGDQDYAAELVFFDAVGGHTSFKTVNPRILGDRAMINSGQIQWSTSVQPTKAKLTEVVELTTMLSQVEPYFSIVHSNGDLFLTIGSKGADCHSASVLLASDIDCGPLPDPDRISYRAPHFFTVLKSASNLPCTISFAQQPIIRMDLETKHGVYDYILRGNEN